MTNEILYQQESVNYQHNNQQNLLETLLEGGWRDFTDAKRRIKLYESQSELASKALKLLETDYSSGKQSFEELLRMERKLLKYQLEKEKAITDSQVAASFLTYLMGK